MTLCGRGQLHLHCSALTLIVAWACQFLVFGGHDPLSGLPLHFGGERYHPLNPTLALHKIHQIGFHYGSRTPLPTPGSFDASRLNVHVESWIMNRSIKSHRWASIAQYYETSSDLVRPLLSRLATLGVIPLPDRLQFPDCTIAEYGRNGLSENKLRVIAPDSIPEPSEHARYRDALARTLGARCTYSKDELEAMAAAKGIELAPSKTLLELMARLFSKGLMPNKGAMLTREALVERVEAYMRGELDETVLADPHKKRNRRPNSKRPEGYKDMRLFLMAAAAPSTGKGGTHDLATKLGIRTNYNRFEMEDRMVELGHELKDMQALKARELDQLAAQSGFTRRVTSDILWKAIHLCRAGKLPAFCKEKTKRALDDPQSTLPASRRPKRTKVKKWALIGVLEQKIR